ncbi:MAG: metal-sensitive transcriptional regulator [Candidatus Nanopelagicales bacterium]
MQLDDSCQQEVTNRLKRIHGQVAGIIAMIEDGRDCAEVVTQMAAASRALDRAGLRVISDGLQQCAVAAARGEDPPMTAEQLEKLFLSLS